MKIKELPITERPRERLIKYGANSLSLKELLTIILKSGTKNNDIENLSNDIMKLIGQVDSLGNISIHQLLKLKGMGQAKACTLLATIELGKRVIKEKNEKLDFSNPDDIYKYFKELYDGIKQEEFYCLYLDNKKRLIEKKLLFRGTINQSLIHPREIFKEAYMLSASFIICIHNHPTGDVTPSIADIESTKLIYQLSKIHAIGLIDHIIIGYDKYYSFYLEKNVIL